jgi:hypothetical protein
MSNFTKLPVEPDEHQSPQWVKKALFWLVIALISGFFFSLGYFYGRGDEPAKIVIEKNFSH